MEFARQPIRNDRLTAGPYFTVINRTSRVLFVTVDGVQFPMKPGVNRDVPAPVAQYAEKQHPRRGTFDTQIKGGETLLVVKELCADPKRYSMIPPGQEHLGAELTNRDEHPHDQPTTFRQLSKTSGYDESPFGGEQLGAIDLTGDPDK